MPGSNENVTYRSVPKGRERQVLTLFKSPFGEKMVSRPTISTVPLARRWFISIIRSSARDVDRSRCKLKQKEPTPVRTTSRPCYLSHGKALPHSPASHTSEKLLRCGVRACSVSGLRVLSGGRRCANESTHLSASRGASSQLLINEITILYAMFVLLSAIAPRKVGIGRFNRKA